MFPRHGPRWIVLICLLASAGCAAAVPYRYGYRRADLPAAPVAEAPAEDGGPWVEFGKPNKRLDSVASLVALPEKIMGLNGKIDNHSVSIDTVRKLRGYLDDNDMADVAIYVNCYDPKEQWRRLRENRQVGAGWRYTFGTFSLVGYTLLPNRVFGGDIYNPYTNSLYINSDVPAIAMLEAAFAKQIHGHRMRGTYVAMTFVPGVALARQCRAVGDVLGYARAQHDWETERQGYHVLYSQVGAEAGAYAVLVTPVWWAAPALGAGGAAVGHAAGRMIAAHRAKQVGPAESAGSDRLAAGPAATAAPTDEVVTSERSDVPVGPASNDGDAPPVAAALDQFADD